MHRYIIHIGIAHVNQLSKIEPELINRIRLGMEAITQRFGGRVLEPYIYEFSLLFNETAQHIAEAVESMRLYLQENSEELYGTTILIFAGKKGEIISSRIEAFLIRIPYENGVWLAKELEDDFINYFNLREEGGLLSLDSFKESGARLEERLPKILVRSDLLLNLRGALETLEQGTNGCKILLIRGILGSGKRATLYEAFQNMHPENIPPSIVLPFSDNEENLLEPFIRSITDFPSWVADYLDEVDSTWWLVEGERLIKSATKNIGWENIAELSDSDFLRAYTLYLKASIRKEHQHGRFVYIIADGFYPHTEAVVLLKSIFSTMLEEIGFRLIVIWDSDDFDEALPLSGKGHEICFHPPSFTDLSKIVKQASPNSGITKSEIKKFLNRCGANIYTLFHYLLMRDVGQSKSFNATKMLFESLDKATQQTFFLAHISDGFSNREIIIGRFPNPEEQFLEGRRYDALLIYGLIRESTDGTVQGLFPPLLKQFISEPENLNQAKLFGEYLYQSYLSGVSLELFRLFRFLERWGPVKRSIAVLELLLKSLLTQRRLRAVTKLLNSSLMTQAKIGDSNDLEIFSNVINAAKMRYLLLSGNMEKIYRFARISIASFSRTGGGKYMARVRLYNASYYYSCAQWENALISAKDALFLFQKDGDHEGETEAHTELALVLLSLGKIRDALEHFAIARRIGSQINAKWGVLRAISLESLTQFLFGNLSRGMRESQEKRKIAHESVRNDQWFLLTLIQIRTLWELGRLEEALNLTEEGCRIAEYCNLFAEKRVMKIWKGRILLARGYDEGKILLESFIPLKNEPKREALAFLAEQAWLQGEHSEALRLINLAAREQRKRVRIQGEGNDWSDGYFPIEGRLANAQEPLDVLGERIKGLQLFFKASCGDERAILRLYALIEDDGQRIPKPFSYQYELWAALATPEDDKENRMRYMSKAFKGLQTRASRFDDNQTKHDWLTENYWNKLLMEEAQKNQLI